MANQPIQRFGADFGSHIRFAFMVGKMQSLATEAARINLWPNPADDFIMLDFSTFKPEELNGTCNIEIHDIRGRLVMNSAIDLNNKPMPSLNVSALSSGVYHLKLAYKDQVIREKLIKH